tara:strand:+ start:2905 stop:3708 length:804 start_codon:yes stop_codon:yes gene_type:complete
MPEALTIKDSPTPAVAPDAPTTESTETTEESGLLAGKYKSQEELEKGYLELQKKLGTETTEDSGITESEPEQEENETPQTATELYGDYIGSKFDEAGIDYQGMNERWQETGQLTDEDYGDLNEAGFSRDMVEAYLQGVQVNAQRDTELQQGQVKEIQDQYGGEAAYREMIDWAAGVLTDSEKSAFDMAIKNPNYDMVKLAVAGLHSRYQSEGNREPKLVSGRTNKRGSRAKFDSTAQVIAAMNDPLYKTDPAYRAKVEEKLSRSNVM